MSIVHVKALVSEIMSEPLRKILQII